MKISGCNFFGGGHGILCLVVIGLGGAVFAQELVPGEIPNPIAIEIPEGPLLEAAPKFSKWTTSYTYSKAANSGSSQNTGNAPSRAVVTKTQNIIHEEIFDGRGERLDTWYLGQQQYRKPPGKDEWYLSEPARSNTLQDSGYDPLPANGFREWDWVGRESYAGQNEYQGKACLVFVPGGSAKVQGTDLAKSFNEQWHVAYVDLATRLPVALRKGGMVQRYQFETLPPVLQTIPTALREQIKKNEEARGRLLQAAPRPY